MKFWKDKPYSKNEMKFNEKKLKKSIFAFF